MIEAERLIFDFINFKLKHGSSLEEVLKDLGYKKSPEINQDSISSLCENLTIKNLDRIKKIKALEAENTELKKQILVWHDLRKNPDDLPPEFVSVLVYLEIHPLYYSAYCQIESGKVNWRSNLSNATINNVIAWAEVPKFKE